jgi:DNA helicase TIP49 (TBP-interacting protein)
MENQHRKISGYRELNQQEIDLMNRIKALGPLIEAVVYDVKEHVDLNDHTKEFIDAECQKWLEDGKMEMKKGLMSLTRAVARPTFF